MKANLNTSSKLDILFCDLITVEDENIMLELCLSRKPRHLAAIPLRYRLIMLGFVKKMTLNEVNAKLMENGCPKLYARNFREATLIYAFSNGLSYQEWKGLQKDYLSLRRRIAAADQTLSDKTVSLADISAYVDDHSLRECSVAITVHETQVLEQAIMQLGSDQRKLHLFLLSNIHSFSTAREKTRYYFCKYLRYFLETRIRRYLDFLEKDIWKGEALEDLSVFRVTKKLSRKKHTPEQARAALEESALSPGGIYGAFSAYYFDYITVDWTEILLEIYYDPEDMPEDTKRRLAGAIRGEEAETGKLSDMSDEEVILWKQEELEKLEDAEERNAVRGDTAAAGYQNGRMGKNFITNVLKGEVDLDRTTFIAFLLFFGACSEIPEEHSIDEKRLDDILTECGFAMLSREDPFDDFAIRLLEAPDPMELVQEEAEILAGKGENFYFYKTYNTSKSTYKKWEELL